MQKYLDPSLGSDNIHQFRDIIHQFRDIIRHAVIRERVIS